MISEKEITKMLEEIESDERLYYPIATVFVNAPLALHQAVSAAKSDLLRKILGLEINKNFYKSKTSRRKNEKK